MAMICVNGGKSCDGCMKCRKESEYICPICQTELEYDDKVYLNIKGRYIGCCYCVEETEAENELGVRGRHERV